MWAQLKILDRALTTDVSSILQVSTLKLGELLVVCGVVENGSVLQALLSFAAS